MLEVHLPNRGPLAVRRANNGGLLVNDTPFEGLAERRSDQEWDVTQNGIPQKVFVLSVEAGSGKAKLMVNGKKVSVQLTTQADLYAKLIGAEGQSVKKIKDLPAPMPGLVRRVDVQPGDAVKAGDPLIVLEAMKMENILKAPADAVVKSVLVHPGDAVEKKRVLIEFV